MGGSCRSSPWRFRFWLRITATSEAFHFIQGIFELIAIGKDTGAASMCNCFCSFEIENFIF
jgi:hypothetical protein